MSTSRLYAPVAPGIHPANATDAYRSSAKRAPREALVVIPETLSEVSGPRCGRERLGHAGHDLTRPAGARGGEALGQRIIVHGRLLDERGRPERGALVEVWQANAAGRYLHDGDRHDAPLDPNFSGRGAVLTDDEGRYRFLTIEPGIYPWGNHYNAWRPKHIHFSLFGQAWATRLVTQMYFPGDPTLPLDPIFMGVPDEAARARLVSRFDITCSEPDYAMAYEFDIVLRGADGTPWEGRP
ncbi:MAG: protocatechuate 3,4-dioxygenase subunit beta [Proteobacteria bacterium]|nr:protocatechuate 3,4-dioxygenase subunit beta [Pseudomonadota bacterium]